MVNNNERKTAKKKLRKKERKKETRDNVKLRQRKMSFRALIAVK